MYELMETRLQLAPTERDFRIWGPKYLNEGKCLPATEILYASSFAY